MSRLRNSVLLLAAVFTAASAAHTRPVDHLVRSEADEFWTKIDALIAQSQFARAEQMVTGRLTAGEDAATIYFQLGKIYFKHEEWRRSAEFLEKSLGLKSVHDEAHQLLGLDWRELHRPDDAEAELLQATRENPSNPVNAYFAGHQLLLDGKFEASLPYLYGALAWKPLQPQVLQALAVAQARLGNYGLAESYCRRVIESSQSSSSDRYAAFVDLSTLLLLGHNSPRLEEGLRCAQEAAQLEPDSPVAHFLAGKALFKIGRLEEASSELTVGAKLNPGDSRPHFVLAQIYDRLGQHDHARKELKTVAELQGRQARAGMATIDPVPLAPEKP